MAGIKPFARPLAREHDRRGEMREGMHRRRIGEIVRRHIDRLDRGDGAGVGVGDALLQPRQLGAHRRLIAQTRRHLPHQARHLHAGLDEAEDVVDEQQHVAVLVVAEILGHRQRRVADAEAAARRLVHLAEDHHHVRQHAGLLHLAVELLAFAAALADAAENAHALVVPDHVVDHLGEQHRLAHARAAEQPRLAAALQRHEHVDDLDARFEDLRLGGAPRQRRRCAMHGAPLRHRSAPARGRWRCRRRRTSARESLCPPAPSAARRCPPPPCRARAPAWASAQSRARDARRAAPALR